MCTPICILERYYIIRSFSKLISAACWEMEKNSSFYRVKFPVGEEIKTEVFVRRLWKQIGLEDEDEKRVKHCTVSF